MASAGKSYRLKMLTLLSCPLLRAGVSECGKYLGSTKGYDQTSLTNLRAPTRSEFLNSVFWAAELSKRGLGKVVQAQALSFLHFFGMWCVLHRPVEGTAAEISLCSTETLEASPIWKITSWQILGEPVTEICFISFWNFLRYFPLPPLFSLLSLSHDQF